MTHSIELKLDGQTATLPLIEGTAGEKAIDISKLRDQTGYITLDDGYGNTGSCLSKITFIDGEKGILRYRGIPIEELAEKSTFIETAYLIIYGHLPNRAELKRFSDLLTRERDAPRGHEVSTSRASRRTRIRWRSFGDDQRRQLLLSRDLMNRHAAKTFRRARGAADLPGAHHRGVLLPQVARACRSSIPRPNYKYTANFLHMMFSMPYEDYELKPEVVRALDLIFLLHADHEQNCSTSTVRMVASSQANMFASCAAGVCALVGPAARRRQPGRDRNARADPQVRRRRLEVHHGRQGQEQRQEAHGLRPPRLQELRPARQDHQESAATKLLAELNINDPLLDIAKQLEEAALEGLLLRRAQALPERGFLQRHHHARHRHSAWRCSR